MIGQLTNEEIARVFAMYWMACKVSITTEAGTRYEYDNNEITISSVLKGVRYKMEQIPLSKISDEDAEALSEVFFPDGNIYDYLHGAPTGKAIVKSISHNRQTNTFYPQARIHDGFEYLKLKGYAVPLFLAPNHWANGKTAVELGIAIDKTLSLEPKI